MDEEQFITIKHFWHSKIKRSRIFFIFIIIALMAVGFIYYRHHKRVQVMQASVIYHNILQALHENDLLTAKSQSLLLMTDYKATVFAALAQLSLAKVAVMQSNLDLAKEYLQALIQHSPKSPWLDIAKTRLARILSAKGEYSAALQVLSQPNDSYAAWYDEIRGDIYFAQNLLSQAAKAYKDAQAKLPNDIKSPWLNLKLADLGGEEKND